MIQDGAAEDFMLFGQFNNECGRCQSSLIRGTKQGRLSAQFYPKIIFASGIRWVSPFQQNVNAVSNNKYPQTINMKENIHVEKSI